MSVSSRRLIATVSLLACCLLTVLASEQPYSWAQAQARVTETGDLEWTPQPYRFEAGDSVRYIDYEGGDDSNDGTAPERAWKHHPWDAQADGAAAATSGIHTFVFKGGVTYRGQLVIRDHGKPGNQIRLTRDPAWGDGPATIAGSLPATGWTRGAGHPDIPQADQVWWTDLDISPRSLWLVADDGSARRIPLARTPNWQPDPIDFREHWWSWTNEEAHFFQNPTGPVAYDTVNIKGRDPKFFEGAIIRSQFGWVMGTPYPTRVLSVDTETGGIEFGRWTDGRSRAGGRGNIIMRGMRYYLEDKPHYLDDPEGEFWFDRQGDGGRLYVRLPDGLDPNHLRLEAGYLQDLILGDDARHLVISGLDFRFTAPHWDLDVVSWDFSTRPWGYRSEAHPACIRIWGDGKDITISHNRFRDGVSAISLRAYPGRRHLDGIRITDNHLEHLDTGGFDISSGAGWGYTQPAGFVGDVRVLRNRGYRIGFRPDRYSRGTAINFSGVRTVEAAGNILEHIGAQGINVYAGKGGGQWGDLPFTRTLIHHNKVWKSMQISDDFGGIEVWQHGPMYIYNNLSHDARGLWDARRRFHGSNPGFGHAYYLDGGFKAYLFNNIAWGLSNDPTTKLVNCSAFQEIYSFQNAFFNNTAYNFFVGSRRQAPQAGRNKYLGNIWQSMSDRAFRHAAPARTEADGNIGDVRDHSDDFAYETNAYARNVFHDVAQIGVFESTGRWLHTLEEFRSALVERDTQTTETGVMDDTAPLRDPAQGDFRLHAGSAAIDRGAVLFVPWALSGVVGEWHFYHAGGDPTRIVDEHWYAKDYYTDRGGYRHMPRYCLSAPNATADDYQQGALDNWTQGVLRFDPERQIFATVSNEHLMRDLTVRSRRVARHFGADSRVEEITISGPELKSPQIWDGNLLIELHFQAEPGSHGLLVGKMDGRGYRLRIDRNGTAAFALFGADGQAAEVFSRAIVNDGSWHHLLVEADRAAQTLTIYIDGTLDHRAPGIGAACIANDGDLCVGGTPDGQHFSGAMQFLRIAHGTLAEADTSIEELYAWQFDGPHLRDMRGQAPLGEGRDAGALESH